MKQLLRHPALHFALLGGLIWLAVQTWQDWQFRVIHMPTASEITQLESRWQQRNNQTLDDAVRQALLRQELDQRMLFREALRRKMHLRDPVVLMRLRQDAQFLGLQGDGAELVQSAIDLQLYQGDDVIRRRLLERMRTLASGPVSQPDDAQLRALLQADESNLAPRFSFRQLFYRRDVQAPEKARARAVKALAISNPEQSHSDAFLHGSRFETLDQAAIAQRFGREFASALSRYKIGQWQGPLESRYGWHLVFLEASKPIATSQQLQRNRARLTRLWQEQESRQKLADYLKRLRPHYRVVST